jgi:isopentenyl diphosphate isomerase/L-lactate dehydrogenase-like FMN-dependent dehydrogenase
MSELQHHAVPVDIVCSYDYQRYAENLLEKSSWDYIAGGSGDELTLNKNQQAFNDLGLHQELLPDISALDTSVQLLDEYHQYPMLIAPIAYQKLAHCDGELAMVQAANAQDVSMILSTLSSVSLEQVSQYKTEQPLWFQLYIQANQQDTNDLILRAENSGYKAIVITLDAPINGLRNREQRSQFILPEGVVAQNLQNYLQISSQMTTSGLSDKSLSLAQLLAQAPRWQDIELIIKKTKLPVYLKGILTPEDALKAKNLGVAGIVVSNHGGRILDGVCTSIEALPHIRKAVGKDMVILLDSGIRRGSDIFKALALGANSVLIGRPVIYALATAGAMGVAHCLRLLKDEFELTMALTGCASISDITADKVRQ